MSINLYSFCIISTETDIPNCVMQFVYNMLFAVNNVGNLSSQAAQLQTQVQEAQNIISNSNIFNIFNIFNNLRLRGWIANITTSGRQLSTNLPIVMTQVNTAFSNFTTQLSACGTTGAATAGQQLNTILANVQSCTQNSGWIVFLVRRGSKVT